MPNVERLATRAWQRLPYGLAHSTPARWARRRAVTRLRGAPPPTQRVLRTLDELDEVLAELEVAGRVSDDALRRGFSGFRFEADVRLPDDPFCDAYREAVLDLYAWLHGAPYQPANEAAAIDVAAATVTPFPYSTHNPTIVGEHLMALGHLIRTLGLGRGDRVLELGPGWGNLTIALARMGCEVTAVDIAAEFVRLVGARAQRVGVPLEIRRGDFSAVAELTGVYDAVVFFESFHHNPHHLDMLADLHRVVAPGGRVVLAGEPVWRGFPVAWGLRLDGESVWAIRRNGWLELGFRRDYFRRALARTGWRAQRVSLPGISAGEIFVARAAAAG